MRAFYAYPSSLADVKQVIHTTKSILSVTRRDLDLHLWEENDISGRPLTDPIFEGIAGADILVADITAMNFNVTFEVGYAIGLGKRIYLTRDENITRYLALANRIGIFDTLGFETYTDELTLSDLLKTYRSDGGIPLRPLINLKTPVYVLQTPQSNWAMIAITARIKKARLGYKGYLPTDDPRLSAVKAIDDISSCLGAVVPLLSTQFGDAEVHNIRAAFVAGLSIAMGKITLVLQPNDGPAPLDIRDLVKTFNSPEDIAESIATFALDVTERFQADNPLPLPKGNFLAELSIGDENPRYLYELGYDMKLLSALAKKVEDNLTYVLNPAFHPGLNL